MHPEAGPLNQQPAVDDGGCRDQLKPEILLESVLRIEGSVKIWRRCDGPNYLVLQEAAWQLLLLLLRNIRSVFVKVLVLLGFRPPL